MLWSSTACSRLAAMAGLSRARAGSAGHRHWTCNCRGPGPDEWRRGQRSRGVRARVHRQADRASTGRCRCQPAPAPAVVDAIARHGHYRPAPAPCSADLRLVFGRRAGMDPLGRVFVCQHDAQLAADRQRCVRMIPCDHHYIHASRAGPSLSLDGLLARWVSQADQSK